MTNNLDVKELIKAIDAMSEAVKDPTTRFVSEGVSSLMIHGWKTRARRVTCPNGDTIVVAVCYVTFFVPEKFSEPQRRWVGMRGTEPMLQLQPWMAADAILDVAIADLLYEFSLEKQDYVGLAREKSRG